MLGGHRLLLGRWLARSSSEGDERVSGGRRLAVSGHDPRANQGGVAVMGSEEMLGPVDYLVVEFPAEKANFSGEMAAELTSLVERGLVRVLDLVLLEKNEDGSIEVAELSDADEATVGKLLSLEGDLAMLLAAEDVEKFSEIIEPGSIAAVLVYENRWAGPFGASVRRSGGQLVANGRIPTQALLAAMESEVVMEGV
jgi:hypothetical protein